ncbi:MAG: glycosyltransferase family 4 protein [Candidatus Omnitrophica bacterium]|nr:glycosyltransferase family 4 protein [Candidatus Omnitrophota bacterium]
MKILLIGNYSYDVQESMQLFASSLEAGLKKSGCEVLLIRPEPFFGKLKPSYRGIGKWLGYLDKFIIFPLRLHKVIKTVDMAHICDHSNAFYTGYLNDIPHLVTCHDLFAIHSARGEVKENPTKWTGRRLQEIILNGINRSMHVACASEATRSDLLQMTSLRPENVSVVYYGFNYPYSPMETTEAKGRLKSLGITSEDPFILHVGKNFWYKNRLGLLEIFRYMIQSDRSLHLNLVLVGSLITEEARRFVKSHNLEKRIFEIGLVKSEQLRVLYSTAGALLYPSLKEGFGWPIIEAQACGCPVFTTKRPPMTEIGGDAAVYVDPAKPEAAARTIMEYISDSEKIAKMRESGFLNVKRFSIDKMIRQYIDLYERLAVRRKSYAET